MHFVMHHVMHYILHYVLQVLGYPSRIVLDFARGLGLGLRGMMTTGNIVRIHPSIEALQVRHVVHCIVHDIVHYIVLHLMLHIEALQVAHY